MSCYTRYLSSLLEETGLDDAGENRRNADSILRRAVSKVDADCPEVWREVKT